jgi:septum formation protein
VGHLLLASRSPRRHELLCAAGYPVETIDPRVKELVSPDLTLRELTLANAARKALAVRRKNPAGIVLGADTLVALGDKVLGKPRDLVHARAILRQLSGRTHEVCTSVYLIGPRRNFISFAEISRVRFRKLNDKIIAQYFRKVNPLDKAGAYAAQGEEGEMLIASITGSQSNVVGLPMERTTEALASFGIRPAANET